MEPHPLAYEPPHPLAYGAPHPLAYGTAHHLEPPLGPPRRPEAVLWQPHHAASLPAASGHASLPAASGHAPLPAAPCHADTFPTSAPGHADTFPTSAPGHADTFPTSAPGHADTFPTSAPGHADTFPTSAPGHADTFPTSAPCHADTFPAAAPGHADTFLTAAPAAPPPGAAQLPARLLLQVDAQHGVTAEDGLVIDKRQLSLRLCAVDSRGTPHCKTITAKVTLEFDDGSPLPSDSQASALSGKVEATLRGEPVTMRLRVMHCSSILNKRKFRLCVMPSFQGEPLVNLQVVTQPFTVVNSTDRRRTKLKPPSAPSRPSEPSSSRQIHPLPRRRYFAASFLRASTRSSSGVRPLSRAAVGMCDRLAALVVQQLARRARTLARRRGTRAILADDVARAVAPPSGLDFLSYFGVVKPEAHDAA